MNKKVVVGGALTIVLIAAAIWFFGLSDREDPAVVAIREQFAQREGMSEQDRAALQTQIAGLSEEQRQMLFEPMMQSRAKEMQSRAYALLAMPENQRKAELDKMIDEMEQRRRSWAANGERCPFGPPGEMSAADRDRRMKGMLDRTTPEMRATMHQMTKMMNQRREERGMEPIRGPR
jgi:hypothetical protein